MSSEGMVSLFVIVCMMYLLTGLVTVALLYDISELKNPLWKIPFFLLWPISAFYVIVGMSIISYIKEVKQYYEDKRYEKRL